MVSDTTDLRALLERERLCLDCLARKAGRRPDAVARALEELGTTVRLSQQPALQPTSQQLPQQRLAAFYVGLDQIATTAANYAKAFGMPVNFQLPPDLPPAGVALSTTENTIRGDGFLPTQTVQSIIAAGMQTYMQMQGGQQPGGAGGAGGL